MKGFKASCEALIIHIYSSTAVSDIKQPLLGPSMAFLTYREKCEVGVNIKTTANNQAICKVIPSLLKVITDVKENKRQQKNPTWLCISWWLYYKHLRVTDQNCGSVEYPTDMSY